MVLEASENGVAIFLQQDAVVERLTSYNAFVRSLDGRVSGSVFVNRICVPEGQDKITRLDENFLKPGQVVKISYALIRGNYVILFLALDGKHLPNIMVVQQLASELSSHNSAFHRLLIKNLDDIDGYEYERETPSNMKSARSLTSPVDAQFVMDNNTYSSSSAAAMLLIADPHDV